MRVLWITSGWLPEVGGPSIGNLDRAVRMAARNDIELVILAPEHPGVPIVPAEAGLDVRRYPSKTWAPYPEFRVPTFAARRWIEKQVADIDPDVIVNTDLERQYLFSTWSLPGLAWAREHSVAYVGYYHTDFYGFAASYPVWKYLRKFTLRPMITRLYRQVDVTIAASDSSEEQLRGFGLTSDQISRLAFDGVDTAFFRPENYRENGIRDVIPTLQEHTNARTVLSLGRIAPEKRIDITIRAFGELARRPEYLDVQLIIVGEGPGETLDQLKSLAAEEIPRGRVHFHPFIHGEQKAQVLASADVYALPSPHETFSITTTEAMSSGVAVVCADSGAPPTYITDGVNGFLSAPDDVLSFADGLRRALAGTTGPERNLIGDNARKTVQERFSMDSIAEEFSRLLLRLGRQSVGHGQQTKGRTTP